MKQKYSSKESFKIDEEVSYFPQGNEVELFEAAYESNLPVLLKGPTGSGKTRFIEYMAKKLDLPLYTLSCNKNTTRNDIIGRDIFKDGESVWIDGPGLSAVKNNGMLYLDEFVEAKDASVVMHPLSDHRRILPVDKLGTVFKAEDDFMLVASYNHKYQNARQDLKPSTRQRFVTIELNWPTVELETKIIAKESGVNEKIAEKLAKAASEIRNMEKDGLEEGVSPRETVMAGHLIEKKSAPLKDILYSTMIEPVTHEEDDKKSIEEILKNYFEFE